jgi:hypothetical protein
VRIKREKSSQRSNRDVAGLWQSKLLLERCLQRGHFALAANALRETARLRDLEFRPYASYALELENTDRLRQTSHFVPSQIAQSEKPLAYLGGRLREIDQPRLGDLLHPRRQVGRMAECRVVHAQIVTDLPDHDLPRVETHPHREADPLPDAQLVCVAAQLVAQVESGVASPLRVVFVRDRGTEQRHDAVTAILVD